MAERDGPSVLIVGAGLAGVACGLALDAAGYRVRIADKGRKPGGRLATRTSGGAPSLMGEDAPWRFDHGAQYLTARGEDLRAALEGLVARGSAARWDARFATLSPDGLEPERESPPRYVGVPGMTQIAGQLAFDLDLALEAEVAPPARMAAQNEGGGWDLGDFGAADIFLTTAPAAQSRALLAAAPDLAAKTEGAAYEPCIAAMIGLDRRIELPADAFFVDDPEGVLRWAAVNGAKPGGPEGTTCLTLHGTADWSAARLDADADVSKYALWRRFRDLSGEALGGSSWPEPTYHRGHRWRYARAVSFVAPVYDADARAGFAGDWAPPDADGAGRAEDAWASGCALAAQVIAAG
ncbi:MAG: NAD(P)-binding protein [Marivibrio sp.]|uniref:NAD(P)/FAD-dependent oxidoreductase n=1 Tax=Marivibrio sp. TaxID=2039719 RepID=UPI0032EF96C4